MFPSIASAWDQARGLFFPCLPNDLKLDRCNLCGWLFTPFDDWRDRVGVFDDEQLGLYFVCRHHPEMAKEDGGIWDCTRAILVPALPACSRSRILAHEAAYWARVVVLFVWILVKWWTQVLYVRLFHPTKYRRYQAFMRGDLFKET